MGLGTGADDKEYLFDSKFEISGSFGNASKSDPEGTITAGGDRDLAGTEDETGDNLLQ